MDQQKTKVELLENPCIKKQKQQTCTNTTWLISGSIKVARQAQMITLFLISSGPNQKSAIFVIFCEPSKTRVCVLTRFCFVNDDFTTVTVRFSNMQAYSWIAYELQVGTSLERRHN